LFPAAFYICRAARLLTALREMFAKCGVKPLKPALDSTPMFATASAVAGSALKSPCFTRFTPFIPECVYILLCAMLYGNFLTTIGGSHEINF
jgi:hypothetical protein